MSLFFAFHTVQIFDQLSEPGNGACKDFLFDSFSGETLTALYGHFGENAATITDDAEDDDLLTKSECFRTCSALLRCAGMMPEKNVLGLSNYIKSIVSSKKGYSGDLSLPVSLLCLWGHTDDVCKMLAASINSYFDGKCDKGEPEISHEIITKKKLDKRNVRDREKVAEVSAEAALHVLGSILDGSDSSFLATRESILRSEVALNAIEDALEKSMIVAEEVLKPTVSRGVSLQVASGMNYFYYFFRIHPFSLFLLPLNFSFMTTTPTTLTSA